MRDLQANLSTIYYAMYAGFVEGSTDGKPTGEMVAQYTKPRKAEVCVSTPTGTTENTPFGAFTDYDKIVTTANEAFMADEHSVLWIDTLPDLETDGSTNTPYDYTVKKMAHFGGQKTYAVKKHANNEDDAEYLRHLLTIEAISQEEYEAFVRSLSDED